MAGIGIRYAEFARRLPRPGLDVVVVTPGDVTDARAVPVGVPREPPAHRAYLPPRAPGERRILFGGLYDWYDPWPLLRALERLDRPAWRVFVVRTPNAATTPQRVWAAVEAWCRERGFWEGRVQPIDWVPEDRRYDLLRDVDLLV